MNKNDRKTENILFYFVGMLIGIAIGAGFMHGYLGAIQ